MLRAKQQGKHYKNKHPFINSEDTFMNSKKR